MIMVWSMGDARLMTFICAMAASSCMIGASLQTGLYQIGGLEWCLSGSFQQSWFLHIPPRLTGCCTNFGFLPNLGFSVVPDVRRRHPHQHFSIHFHNRCFEM
jgi:hypothetical protein